MTFLRLICPTEGDILGCVALALTKCPVIDFFRRCAPFGSAPYIVRQVDYAYTHWSMCQQQPSYWHNSLHRSKMVHENPKTLGSICSLNSPKWHLSVVREISHECQPIPTLYFEHTHTHKNIQLNVQHLEALMWKGFQIGATATYLYFWVYGLQFIARQQFLHGLHKFKL